MGGGGGGDGGGDGGSDPVQDSLAKHMRRVVTSAVVYANLTVLMVYAPATLARVIAPAAFPLRLQVQPRPPPLPWGLRTITCT